MKRTVIAIFEHGEGIFTVRREVTRGFWADRSASYIAGAMVLAAMNDFDLPDSRGLRCLSVRPGLNQ